MSCLETVIPRRTQSDKPVQPTASDAAAFKDRLKRIAKFTTEGKRMHFWLRGRQLQLLTVVLAVSAAIAQSPVAHLKKVSPSQSQLASSAIERRVDALLAKMTLEEKLGQLMQYSSSGSATPSVTQDNLAANP